MNNHIVVFSGYNQRAVIAFLRVLKRNEIDDFSIIASSKEDTILMTEYRKWVYCIRENKALDREEILGIFKGLRAKKKLENIIILPSTEALNRFVLQNQASFACINVTIPLVDFNTYEKISDKEKFWNYCKNENILVPRVFEFPKRFDEPFVAKPKSYLGSDHVAHSPYLIMSKDDYFKFEKENILDDYTYQEYVHGKSYYLLYYFMKNGEILRGSQVNYLQQNNGKSIVLAAPIDFQEEMLVAKYENAIKKLDFTGFIMIEIRYNEKEYFMIEANPRLWGPSQLFVDAGIPFFEAFLYEVGLLDHIADFTINHSARYCWSGGCQGSLDAPENCMWHGDGMKKFLKEKELFLKYDLYNREDTHSIYVMERNE